MKKRIIVIFAALATFVASADTNDLERARAAFLEARRAYMAALDKYTSYLPKDLQEEAAGDDLSVLAKVVQMKQKVRA